MGELGVDFTLRPSDVDETPLPGEAPHDVVLRLSRAKAEAAGAGDGELVLAADTIVVVDGAILGKPRDPDEARRMLRTIAGREHTVLTGVALVEPGRGRTASAVERSEVRMAAMTDEEIAWYVATGEPLDKAGSYAVQGLGAMYVEAVFGSYTNVVGLPLATLYRLVRELGWDLRELRATSRP